MRLVQHHIPTGVDQHCIPIQFFITGEIVTWMLTSFVMYMLFELVHCFVQFVNRQFYPTARYRELEEELRKAELCCHFMNNALIQARLGQQAVPPDRTVKGIIFKQDDGITPLMHVDHRTNFLYVQGFVLEKLDNSRQRVIHLADNTTFIGDPRHLPSIGVRLDDEIHFW